MLLNCIKNIVQKKNTDVSPSGYAVHHHHAHEKLLPKYLIVKKHKIFNLVTFDILDPNEARKVIRMFLTQASFKAKE